MPLHVVQFCNLCVSVIIIIPKVLCIFIGTKCHPPQGGVINICGASTGLECIRTGQRASLKRSLNITWNSSHRCQTVGVSKAYLFSHPVVFRSSIQSNTVNRGCFITDATLAGSDGAGYHGKFTGHKLDNVEHWQKVSVSNRDDIKQGYKGEKCNLKSKHVQYPGRKGNRDHPYQHPYRPYRKNYKENRKFPCNMEGQFNRCRYSSSPICPHLLISLQYNLLQSFPHGKFAFFLLFP